MKPRMVLIFLEIILSEVPSLKQTTKWKNFQVRFVSLFISLFLFLFFFIIIIIFFFFW